MKKIKNSSKFWLFLLGLPVYLSLKQLYIHYDFIYLEVFKLYTNIVNNPLASIISYAVITLFINALVHTNKNETTLIEKISYVLSPLAWIYFLIIYTIYGLNIFNNCLNKKL